MLVKDSILGSKILASVGVLLRGEREEESHGSYRVLRSATSLSRATFCCFQLPSEEAKFAFAVSAAVRLSRALLCAAAKSRLSVSIALIDSAWATTSLVYRSSAA